MVIRNWLSGFWRSREDDVPAEPTSLSDFLEGRVTETTAESLRQNIDAMLEQTRSDIREGNRQTIQKGLQKTIDRSREDQVDPLRKQVESELGAGSYIAGWLFSGDWLSLASTNVDQIRCFPHDQQLDIRFLNGSEYTFFGVPWEVAAAMAHTDSPGRFVWNFVRDVYPFRRTAQGAKRTQPYPKNVTLRVMTKEMIASGEKTRKEFQEESRIFSRRKLGLQER